MDKEVQRTIHVATFTGGLVGPSIPGRSRGDHPSGRGRSRTRRCHRHPHPEDPGDLDSHSIWYDVLRGRTLHRRPLRGSSLS